MKVLLFLFALFCWFSNSACGQDNLDFILGYRKMNYNAIELGIAKSHRNELKTYSNIHLCGELLYRQPDRCLFGIEAGCDLSFVIFTFSGQAACYFNDRDENFMLRPELGFTIFGFADLTYGYNFFMLQETSELSTHVLSIRVKMPFKEIY